MSNNEPSNELATQQQGDQIERSGDGQQQQENKQSSAWSIIRGLLFRFLIIYLAKTYLLRRDQSDTNTGVPVRSSINIYKNGQLINLFVYISEYEDAPNFRNENELIWIQNGIIFGEWKGGPNDDGIFEYSTNIPVSERVQNNGSLFMHVYLTQDNFDQPRDKYKLPPFTTHSVTQLNRFIKRKYKSTHNLLTGHTSASKESIEKIQNNISEEVISTWHPNITINVIYDQRPWVEGQVPPILEKFIIFEPGTNYYYPIVYFNNFWNLLRDYNPINETTKSLPLKITYQPLSMFRWHMYPAHSMRSQWTEFMMEESDGDHDALKEALLETPPYLIALTVVVFISHTIFELLAFKNDIQFWRNRSSLKGLSVRSVFFNAFQSLIVLLYVLDNDTNTLVRVSVGIGFLIECWKIPKVTNVIIDRENKLFNLIPKIALSDKGSYVESSTKQFDILAFKYLSWALFPLFIGYSIYSLIYLEHKGWYSWVLGMIYGFLLTFGFIAMTPQLFINYKLKSVAHLPWRMLTYKFFNTFIDDVFAFVIKMPTMYRIGCFRDDIIFLIYVYQRWIYRVDPKRINEFGVSGEDLAPSSTVDKVTNSAIAIEDKKDK